MGTLAMDIAWDHPLLEKADVNNISDIAIHLPVHHISETLNSSYQYCEKLTSIYSKSFYMSSALFSREKRRAIRALYAFCRTTDDIIDCQSTSGDLELSNWRESGLSTKPRANDPVSIAWADTRKKYKIPTSYAHQLIDGVASDVHIKRYRNFAELADYCYGVASTVGLMSMHIIGFTGDEATRYAIKLGVALQLTNILRDIAEDYSLGRIYLPQDELKEFGITDDHLRLGIADEKWKTFMKFQVARARQIYEEAIHGISLLNSSGRMPVAAAAAFYQGILDKIEKMDYDVFRSRACMGWWCKVKLLPSLWIKYGLPSRLTEKLHGK